MNYAELIRNAMNKMQALMDKAKSENGRDLTAEELEVFNSLEKDVEKHKAMAEHDKKIQGIRDSLAVQHTPNPVVNVTPTKTTGKEWNGFGEFLMAVKRAYDPSSAYIDSRLVVDRSNPQNIGTGMQVAVSSDGGFMVQKQFVQKMMESVYAKSTTMSKITMFPIGEGSNGIVMPALAEVSRANGSRFGGARAYWANEGGQGTPTKPKIREVTLKLEKLLAFCYMTEELMRDASAMEAFVGKIYSDEMAFVLDDAIFNGSGNGSPLGILNSPALITVTKETGQTADTVVWENIVKMWSRLSPASQTRAAWFINQEVQKELMTMAMSVGTGGVPVFLPAGGASASPYMTLMGRPVIPVEQLSKLGDAGDILLADMSDYIGIDKGGLESDTSIHVQFLYDEQVFRFRYRFNGTPYTNSPVTSFKNASQTVSPYVTLGAR
jgi:HK97 family phage major capsid protein